MQCDECFGSGTCGPCHGDGLAEPFPLDDEQMTPECGACFGDGQCPACHGDGLIPDRDPANAPTDTVPTQG